MVVMYLINLLFTILNYIITIGVSAMLVVSYFSSLISPASVWWLSMVAIVSPILIIATLVMFLINLVRIKLLAIIPFVALVAGIGKISGQFNYVFLKDYNLPSNSIKIATHNVRVFVDENWNSVLDSTVTMVKKVDPDIIAFQEYHTTDAINSDSLNTLFGLFSNYSTALFSDDDTGSGLAIFSKFPIIKKDKLLFNDDVCGMQWVDVVAKSDTLRIFNIHMKSNGIDRNDKTILNSSILSENSVDSTERSHLKNILNKVKSNAETRAFHADTISQIIEASPYSVIVCGDLNDVPFSYTYSKIKGNLNDSFRERGNMFAYSYNQLYRMLKIDYIFTPESYKVGAYTSFETPYSDHNPIVVDLYREK